MRRTAALAALLAAVAAVPAAAAAPGTKLELTATRKLITLPAVPLPGIAYAVQSDLANADGSAAGKLTISCTVVGLTPSCTSRRSACTSTASRTPRSCTPPRG